MELTGEAPGRWTEEEDNLLREAVADCEDDEEISWHKVASHIPGRDNKVCRKRWVYTLAAAVKKGRWDQEEDGRLRIGVEKHGFRWSLVSQVVGSRLPDQCSRRWHECLNPNINHTRWSLLEDRTLKEAVLTYGPKWTEIVERFFPGRTPLTAKNRYKQRFQNRSSAGGTGGSYRELSTFDTSTSPETRFSFEKSGSEPRPGFLWQVPDYSQMQGGQLFRADATEEINRSTFHKSSSITSIPTAEMFDGNILAELGALPASSSAQWPDLSLLCEPPSTVPALSLSTPSYSDNSSLAEPTFPFNPVDIDPSLTEGIAGGFPPVNLPPPHNILSRDSDPLAGFELHPPYPDLSPARDHSGWSSCFLPSTEAFCNDSLGSEDICPQFNQQVFLPQSHLNIHNGYHATAEKIAGNNQVHEEWRNS